MFRVRFFQDSDYEVFELVAPDEWESVFIGSLSDCEAYIRLNQNENVEF